MVLHRRNASLLHSNDTSMLDDMRNEFASFFLKTKAELQFQAIFVINWDKITISYIIS